MFIFLVFFLYGHALAMTYMSIYVYILYMFMHCRELVEIKKTSYLISLESQYITLLL